MASIRLVVFAAVLGICAMPPAAAQQPADDPARVVEQWNRLRQAAPVVRYAVRWEWFPTQAKPGDPKPGDGGAFTGFGVVLLDPTGGRLRVDRDELLHFVNRRERLSRVRTTLRYDGREQSSAIVTAFDAAAAPAEPAFTNVAIGPWGSSIRWPDGFNPLLWGHGLVWTSRDTVTRAFPLGWRAEPDRYRLVGWEEVGRRACVVLRDTAAPKGSTITLWVDDERGVIVRWRRGRRDGTADEIGVTYQETPHGWLPRAWEETQARPGRPPAVSRRVRVEAVTFDLPVAADDFRIAFRPGMTVLHQGGYARVTDDGGLDPMPPTGPPPWPGSLLGRVTAAVRLAGWPGLVGLGAAAILACVFVYLRVRRKPVS